MPGGGAQQSALFFQRSAGRHERGRRRRLSDTARPTASALIETAARIAAFPYANPVHVPLRPLQQEYRKALSGNDYMFYHADEARAVVTVDRVLYASRSEDALLK